MTDILFTPNNPQRQALLPPFYRGRNRVTFWYSYTLERVRLEFETRPV